MLNLINKVFSPSGTRAERVFILMLPLMFLILLCHNVIRVLKDSIVVSELGAEAISFIKLWLEIPFGSLFVLLYYKLSNILNDEKLFRVIVLGFLSLYGIFAFVIHPYSEYFHLSSSSLDALMLDYPHLKWLIIILAKWSITLFYLLGEFWPTVVYTLLFWQLANKITTFEESKIFYPYFNFFGQINLLVAGALVCFLADKNNIFSFLFLNTLNATELAVKSIISLVLFFGVGIITLHYFIEKKVIKANAELKNPNKILVHPTLNILESLKITIKSSALMRIASLMMSYHICVNVIEGIWLAKAFQLYKNSEGFTWYQGQVLFYTAVSGVLFSVLSRTLLRKYDWFIPAVVTPFIILTAGSLFFILVIFQDFFTPIVNIFGFSCLGVIVFIGASQNALGKGAKYGIFDTLKEMLYIPMNKEEAIKGKAAVDIIGTKCGKAIGSIIQCLMFIIIPNVEYAAIAPVLLILYLFAVTVWIWNTNALSKNLNILLK